MKNRHIHIRFVFLLSIIVLLLVGCGTIAPTPTSPYTHYTPSKGSSIRLEFDYPSSWVFTEDVRFTGFIDITLSDPRFRALATPSGPHPTSSDLGWIGIWITPSQSGQTADTELESHKQSYSEISRMTVLNDYKAIVNGEDASVLEYETNDPETSPSLMFNRRTFFIVKDQLYEIYYTVAEKDRGGEFDQGYEYFFNSLKIVQ